VFGGLRVWWAGGVLWGGVRVAVTGGCKLSGANEMVYLNVGRGGVWKKKNTRPTEHRKRGSRLGKENEATFRKFALSDGKCEQAYQEKKNRCRGRPV